VPDADVEDLRLAPAVRPLCHPVTDAGSDRGASERFTTGCFLRRDAMKWFWDRYTTDPARHLRASIPGCRRRRSSSGRADVLRDEGGAYAATLRAAGLPVTAVRHRGIIHGLVMVDAMRDAHAAGPRRARAASSPTTPWTAPDPAARRTARRRIRFRT
jgi:acetyl esterase